MSNPNALLLLADHIKLSLLERQRAKQLNLSSDSQDGQISRSLDQFQEGLDVLEKEVKRLEESDDQTKASTLSSTLTTLRKQQSDLLSQFNTSSSSSSTLPPSLTKPNDPSLLPDFAHAQSKPKTVRFQSPTTSNDPDLEAARSNLFNQPYTDNPEDDDDTAGYANEASNLNNQQIHAYHQRILSEQDEQLDTLSSSISRQRELSLAIGDELDEHVLMLDESERAADQQASALQRARRQVGRIARNQDSGENTRHMVIIVVLILILVLLIVILK
ncbi:hypothetical protein QBC38DRAFT_490762 [Podospora fimiseda]|uniref:t-SNARE coiled-coil homology domain-containing protein n=1 Tax=Podospora fimiseda TaxID=252190 RepID=A0AAN7BFG9_9PEZI|nr:hypothetical protein QBC38DRAFT_490762 [Podospora fimiseda]